MAIITKAGVERYFVPNPELPTFEGPSILSAQADIRRRDDGRQRHAPPAEQLGVGADTRVMDLLALHCVRKRMGRLRLF